MDIIRRTTIEAPAGTIFQCVMDAELIPQWMDNVQSIAYTSEIDPRQPVGTQFSQQVREGPFTRVYQGKVEVYEEPVRFAVRFGDKRFQFRLDYEINPSGKECEVLYRLRTVKEGLFMAFAGRMVAGMADSMANNHIRSLKEFAEARARQSSSQK